MKRLSVEDVNAWIRKKNEQKKAADDKLVVEEKR